MPFLPASGNSTPRRDLAGLVAERLTDLSAFPGLALFPPLYQEGIEIRFQRLVTGSASRLPATTKVGKNAPIQRGTRSFEPVTGSLEEHGLEEAVGWSDQANWSTVFDQKATVARLKTEEMLRRHSADAIALVINNTNFPLSGDTGHNAGTAWSTTTTSTPLTDVNTGKKSIQKRSGRVPNLLVIAYEKLLDLSENTQLRDKIIREHPEMQGMGELDEAAVAMALGVRRVLAVKDYYDASIENDTESLSSLLGTGNGFLAYVSEDDPGADLSLGRTIFNTNLIDPFVVDEYPEQQTRADVVRVLSDHLIKLMDTGCGYRLGNL